MNCKVLIFLLGVSYLLHSCNSQRDASSNYMVALSNQLDSSTKLIRDKTVYFQNHLESKSFDVSMTEKGHIWLPRARSIGRLTSEVFSKIENYKVGLKGGNVLESFDSLFQNLVYYVDRIKALSPDISSVFNSKCLSQLRISKYNLLERNQFDSVFSKSNSLEINMSLLTVLQNKLSLIENTLSEFCDNQVGTTGFTIYNPIPFVSQNLQHLKRGEELVIKAGLCFYNFPSNSKMFIDGNEISKDETGCYTYRLKVSEKVGKQRLPLKFEYFDHLFNKKSKIEFVDYFIE